MSNTNTNEEDIAEIILNHFPSASRRACQEMLEEIQALIFSQCNFARIDELESLLSHPSYAQGTPGYNSLKLRISILKSQIGVNL